jgi:peptidoglycan/xylan/chitin deacetylase (PgdA/CDA1 family)
VQQIVSAPSRLRRLLRALPMLLAIILPGAARAADSAVIVMYHRFGETEYPSTDIRLEQFEAQLKELQSGGYHVMPLEDIVSAFRRKEALPDRAVALTIDDAYRSVYQEAWPRLRKAGLPFTLFASTGPADAGTAGYMTWDELRELASAGVTIGNHTVSHAHLPDIGEDRLRRELEDANSRFREELGFAPKLLAFPYGEYGRREAAAAEAAGFIAAFGQQSGVAYANAELYGLPRFALNEHYGSLDRFRLVANALPLKVYDITPNDTVLRAVNPPPFGFTVDASLDHLDRLNCYASNQAGKAHIERLGERRFEVRLQAPFSPPRGRINCTMPGPDGRWRWYGTQFYLQR